VFVGATAIDDNKALQLLVKLTMEKKTALVTGASVGIGRAIAIQLAAENYQLIVLARREERLLELQELLPSTDIHTIACDINDQQAVAAALDKLPEKFSDIDVLVNNAGLALGLGSAEQALWEDWQRMILTNCMSLAYITRLILPGMVKRNRGAIINIGSIAGTYAYKGGSVYGATKAFVEQFSQNLRADLVGKNIRVCNLEPGLLGDTEFSLVRFHGDEKSADAVYEDCQPLRPEDIAETVRWLLSMPEHFNVNRMEIMPTCQASAGLAIVRQ
jgi:NADP-dependent 3-hydroxy acid dehydrogenase YdfG